MKITYKDVGQGDSIILEWESAGVKKIGIIDCNLKGKRNPVLEHLHAEGYAQIEFIILSHPHRDHYSGMFQLLRYIEERGIVIRRFCNTLHWSSSNYWKYFEINNSDNRQLKRIIKKVGQFRKSNQIRRIDGLEDGKILKLEKNIEMECLAPSHDDAAEYQRIVDADADNNIKEASQAANYLSTIFRLKINNCCILFTSDAENFALEGVIERETDSFATSTFHICQLPHHGSSNNHYSAFWNIIATANPKYAIISAGKHRSYNHPSFEVIKAFYEDGYNVFCTNVVNGMEEFTEYLKALVIASAEFDSASTLAEEYRKSSDRVFILNGDSFQLA